MHRGIPREQIFPYVYAVLHHPDYRARYAENLKRELPRIPMAAPFLDRIGRIRRIDGMEGAEAEETNPVHPKNPDNPVPKKSAIFHAFATAGRKLADLHVGYESVKPFKLARIENNAVPPNWRVEAMKLTTEGDAVIYNDWLTLHGLPPEALAYRLGNRSALAWVLDQYRVDRDADGEILSDPNPPDDEEAIVRLLGQVVTVSVETMKLVKALPELSLEAAAGSTPQSEASAAHFHYVHEEPEIYGDK